MIKKLLFICLLFNTVNSFSQDLVKEFNLKLERKRDYLQVVNETKKEVVLFLNDNEKVTSVKLDSTFTINDSLSHPRLEKSYTDILGYSQKDDNYLLFWGSKDRKKIISQFFNFTKKETGATTFELEFDKEKVFKELTINNVFYLITILKKSGNLKFYIFDNGVLNTRIVDLSNFEFKNKSAAPANLHTVLTEESWDFSVQTISNDSPPSLALSREQFKLYTYKKDEIIFTIDNNPHFTDILRINLNDFTANLKSIKKPVVTRGEYESVLFKSNSFLIDDKILQIKTNPDVLLFTISDLEGTIINKYKTLREEEISFKNTAVFQEVGSLSKKRVLEKPKQFIRKINNSRPSISCYSLNGLYYTVIGSSQDIVHSSPNGAGMGIGAGGFSSGVYFSISPGYTLENLISYKDKNVVYTTCLFDANFNHLEDTIKTSAFEKARAFLEENEEITTRTSIFSKDLYKDLILFKFNTSLYLGNYNKENKKYQIFSFSE
ncbi:hypothetical protein ACHRV5_07655 [Flavobacterium sp. FlaQc-52]|jgi:hypothetical protein|uniref:hypothetical protein n=1 Tax=Flavobacterium sp. FlaQc-52 TaxID=3374185 RepID=UPI0037572460